MEHTKIAEQMKIYRPSWVEVNLAHLKHNYTVTRSLVGDQVKIAAVVKANGYGHGAVEVSKACLAAGVDYLTVAMLSEAVELTEAGILCPILILGWTPEEGYAIAIDQEFRLTLYNLEEVERLNQTALQMGKQAYVHLKLDTGMSRLGFQADAEGMKTAEAVLNMEGICVEGLFSHFSKGDEYDKSYAMEQMAAFRQFAEQLEQRTGKSIPLHHMGASACTIDIPAGHFNMVRPGIMLYGYLPSNQMHHAPDLKPIMTWKARVAHVKTLPAGRMIGYGGTVTLEQDTVIATIPVGYADGYSRMLSNKGYVVCRGKKLPIIGRVCMDQFMVDASQLPDLRTGDEVTLLGSDGEASVTAVELAQCWGTIAYEVISGIANRVPRIYTE